VLAVVSSRLTLTLESGVTPTAVEPAPTAARSTASESVHSRSVEAGSSAKVESRGEGRTYDGCVSNAERVFLYTAAIFVPLSCLVGGLILHPLIPTYIGLAYLGIVAALLPAGVVDVLEAWKHHDYRDRADGLHGSSE
jgi:hypothetical protein